MGKSGFFIVLYPGSDLDHSLNLMGSKLDRDPSSHSFHKDPTSNIYVNLTKQANR